MMSLRSSIVTGVSVVTPSSARPLRIEIQVDFGQLGQIFQHFAQRGIGELQRDRRAELLLDFDSRSERCRLRSPRELAAALGEACPSPWRRREDQRVLVAGERDRRLVHFAQDRRRIPLPSRPAMALLLWKRRTNFACQRTCDDDRVVGVQFGGLLGHDLGLVVALLVHELVELVDHHGELLLRPRLSPAAAVRLPAGCGCSSRPVRFAGGSAR